MFSSHEKRSWFSWFNCSPRRKPRPIRLTLEALEDRMVPSTVSAPFEQIGQILNASESAFQNALASVTAACGRTAADSYSAALAQLNASGDQGANLYNQGYGYSVHQVRQAYGWNFSWNIGGNPDGSGQTIAIIDGGYDPNIRSDLHQFDLAEGLPDPPSFKNYYQTINGQGPSTDSSWAGEEAMDVEWAHAMAPGANIMVVNAFDKYTDYWGQTHQTLQYLEEEAQWAAGQPGVSVVSMSWGANSSFADVDYNDGYFTTPQGHSGVTFVASSGDNSDFIYPASSPNVLAVGGTTLSLKDGSGNYGGETVWNKGEFSGSGGGGEDPYYPGKQGPDVAYNAGAGIQVYDSINNPNTGWAQGGIGGTSAGAPQWAALIAVADQARALKGMSILDGAQTVNLIHNMAGSNFRTDIPGSNGNGASGSEAVGRGSPIADRVVAALADMNLVHPSSNPHSSSAPSAAPSPFDKVAADARSLVRSFESGNISGVYAALLDLESILFNSPGTSPFALEQAFISDVFADL